MNSLNGQQVREMLLYVADSIMENKPLLTAVDAKIGDGDHGIGMSTGMKAAKAKLEALSDVDDVTGLFTTMGKTMLMTMGGASGVIFGTMFMAGGKTCPAQSHLDKALFVSIMSAGLKGIKERGKASVGDKTMIDALEPAVDIMVAYDGDSLLELISLAETASLKGVEMTKTYVAKFGRAKALGERAIGYQDAGATSVYLIFKAMGEYLKSIA